METGVAGMKLEPEEEVVSADVGELRMEIVVMREELGGARMELQAIKESIDVLANRSSAKNERMTDAVKLMKRMVKWLKEKLSQTQQRQPLIPGTAVKQPGQGSPSLQQLPPPSKPLVFPLTSPSLASVSVKKPMSKTPVIAEQEVPASPTKKKVKLNRPNVPSKSCSRWGQTQN